MLSLAASSRHLLGQARCNSPTPLDGPEYLLHEDAVVFQGTKIHEGNSLQARDDEQIPSTPVTATSAGDAPVHYLQLTKSMLHCEQHDYELATSVLKTMSNHRWNLIQELVPPVWFSSHDRMRKCAKEKLAVNCQK